METTREDKPTVPVPPITEAELMAEEKRRREEERLERRRNSKLRVTVGGEL